MQISDERIIEFIEIYRAEFEKDISREHTLEMSTRLINLYLMIYRPLPGEHESSTTRLLEDRHGPDTSFQLAE